MAEEIQALILGLVQGLTEYLPVSSSGHLTIAQALLPGFPKEENLTLDIVLHVATVLSTIVILWREIAAIFCGFFKKTGLRPEVWNEDQSYVVKICISMIPVFIVGMFFKDFVEEIFGSGLLIVGICLLVTAALLAFSYFAKPRQKDDISYLDAFVIGLAQAVAVLPGLSRSGSTIATGLLLGDKKEKVAQFSFIMVIIPILGEAFLECLKAVKMGGFDTSLSITALAIGFVAAFVSGCLACKFMLDIVKKGKLIWFAVYCVFAGVCAIVIS